MSAVLTKRWAECLVFHTLVGKCMVGERGGERAGMADIAPAHLRQSMQSACWLR